MPRALTKAQQRALRAISNFIVANGFPPTLAEIKNLLGHASDQSVIELLVRLEKAGMVTRDPGQARSIRITETGIEQLGPLSEEEPPTDRIKLSTRQMEVYRALLDLHQDYANMYLSAVGVLSADYILDRIAQSAHSMREIVLHLKGPKINKKSDAAKAAEEDERTNAMLLASVFDPLGGTAHLLKKNLYDAWNDYHADFNNVAHHGMKPTMAEYVAMMESYEDFLCRYVFPDQTHTYEAIDKILSQNPEAVSVDELRKVISKNLESYSYFWRTVDISWLTTLQKAGFVTSHYDVAGFLARAANQYPEEVLTEILGMDLQNAHWLTVSKLLDAAVQMPIATGQKLVDKIVASKLPTSVQAGLNSHALAEFLKHLLANDAFGQALKLTYALLDVDITEGQRRAGGYIEDYQYEQVLEELEKVPTERIPRFIQLLVKNLGKALRLEYPERDDLDDISHVWHPAVENKGDSWNHHGIKNRLIISLVKMLESYVEFHKNNPETTAFKKPLKENLEAILKTEPNFAIFDRIRFHLYRLHPDVFSEEIERVIIDRIGDRSVWHEYALLIDSVFPSLSNDVQKKYLDIVEAGPADKDERYRQFWSARQLQLVKKHLSEEQVTKYEDLLKMTDDSEDPTFLSTTRSWVGPTSPFEKGSLIAHSVDDVIKELLEWKPGTDHFAPSREGLGRVFETVVSEKPKEYSEAAKQLLASGIHPVYLTHFFRGITNVIRNKMRKDDGSNLEIAWLPMIELAAEIITKAREGLLPEPEKDGGDEDRWDRGWLDVLQEIARFLEDALNQNADPIVDASMKGMIWECIDYLCEHPDPSPAREAEEGSMDAYTLSINTVRGEAFHALFAYIYWLDRQLSKEEKTTRIPEEAKTKIRDYLLAYKKHNKMGHVVIGRNFFWVFIYDRAFAMEIHKLLFTQDICGETAWAAFLSHRISGDVYALLREHYASAVQRLPTLSVEDTRFLNPGQNLLEHVAIGYVYGWDKNDELLCECIEQANAKQRGHMWSYVGRAYIHKEDEVKNPPDSSRLQALWMDRLEKSVEIDELKEFGWWAKAGYFEDEWMLERLNETLKKTKGEIEAEHWVMETLEQCSLNNPLLCAKALESLVSTRNQERFFYGRYESEITNSLTAIYRSGDQRAIKIADRVVDQLTMRGFEKYRNIRGQSSDGGPESENPPK